MRRGRGRGRGRRLLLRFVLAVVARPRRTLGVAALIVGACVALAAARLSFSTDENKLFSPSVPFFRQWLDFMARFPENQALYVVVEPPKDAAPPPVARWVAAAEAITKRLRELPAYVKSVDSHVPLDELGSQGLLFESPAALSGIVAEAKRFEPLAKLWGEAPGGAARLLGGTPMGRFLVGLNLDALRGGVDAETAAFVRLLADSWVRVARGADGRASVPDVTTAGASDPQRLGYYYQPDAQDASRHLLLVRAYPVESHDSLESHVRSVEQIRATVDAAAKDFPEFEIGITGRPAVEADELQTTDRDSHRAEVVALAAVFVGLALVLRSLWLALAAEIALAVGIGWTFGYATAAVGELNLLSLVFLIALIGIGMDYLVQILTRYRAEAAVYRRGREIWPRVFRRVAAPINTACLGASGAFLASTLTDFRGAAELGVIAGGGLLLTLLAGYTVLPALLVVWPVRPAAAATPRRVRFSGRAFAESAEVRPLKRTLREEAAPPDGKSFRRLVPPTAWLVALVAAIPLMLRSHFDPGLLNLQAQNLQSVQLIRKLQTWSAVVLSKDLDKLREVRRALAGAPTVASTESLLDAQDNAAWLAAHAGELPAVRWAEPTPITAADVPALATAAEALAGAIRSSEAAGPLRDFAAACRAPGGGSESLASRLSAWQVGFIGQLRDTLANLRPARLDVAKLPAELRGHFVSADGTYALYVNPAADLWNQENLKRFVLEVSERVKRVPGAPDVTGIAADIYYTTASVETSFYRAAAYALALIVLLVLLDLRRVGQTLAAVSVLALGLPMLVALMGALGVRWNFANFFGLPILIGAGHEYGVFLVHRYREARESPARAWRPGDASDRALLLCAYVTATSFAFFWLMGHHEGLKSLGLVMALGTACIYGAAVAVLRPLLLWQLDRREASS